MTIKELITELLNYPLDREVIVHTDVSFEDGSSKIVTHVGPDVWDASDNEHKINEHLKNLPDNTPTVRIA